MPHLEARLSHHVKPIRGPRRNFLKLVEIPLRELLVGESQAVPDFRILGVRRRELSETFCRLLEPAERKENFGQGLWRVQVVRLNLEDPLEGLDGLRGLAQVEVGRSQKEPRRHNGKDEEFLG